MKLGLLFLPLLMIGAIACQPSTSTPFDTLPPQTRMANIPVEGDTLTPIITFHWSGGDADGFVAGYEYRYKTTRVSTGEEIQTDWVFTENTSETITFFSDDLLNRQEFEVRAVDNEGKRDPNPPKRTVYTLPTFPPNTQILSPLNNERRFVLEETSDWWEGIELAFTGSDRDGKIVEYGWSVDGSDFYWTRDTLVLIQPDLLARPLTGEHTIVVTSRDDTGLTDPTPDTVIVHLIEPKFSRTLLIVDDTNENNWQSGVQYTDTEVDDFYTAVTASIPESQITRWDIQKLGLPGREVIGDHKIVFWHSDDRVTSNNIPIRDAKPVLTDYANIGGDLIITGWQVIKSLANNQPFPIIFPAQDFVNTYLHIEEASETPFLADFTIASGVGGYPDIHVDQSKLANDFRSTKGAIYRVDMVDRRGPFTDMIYSYGAPADARYPEFRGKTVGIFYFGSSFNTVVLGFPLFFTVEADARAFFDNVLTEMGYLE